MACLYLSETTLDTKSNVQLKNLEYVMSIPANDLRYLGLPRLVFMNCPNSPNTMKLV